MKAPPWLERFLSQYPQLASLVDRLLGAGQVLREVTRQAFVDPPEPQPPDRRQALVQLAEAAQNLESTPTRENAAQLLHLLSVERAESHVLSHTRATSGPVARWALTQALHLWKNSWDELNQPCAQRGTAPPQRLLFTSHVDENLPWSQVRLVGNELPWVPVAQLPWGERCALTGQWWQTDGPPQLRFRCADSFFTLGEEAYQTFVRCQRAVASLEAREPALAQALRSAFPELALPFYPDTSGPTFSSLGLREFPSLAVSLHNALLRFARRKLFFRPHNGGSLTYGEARRRPLSLCKSLQDLGIAPGERVALVFRQPCWEAYIADFACVFAGVVSVGLDPFAPAEQRRRILELVQPKALLTDDPPLAALPETTTPVLCLGGEQAGNELPQDPLPPDWVSASGVGAETPLLFDDAAGWQEAHQWGIRPDREDELYTVIFTSGPTGAPKGVPITRTRMRAGMAYDAHVYPLVVASYQPFALLADRKLVWQALFNGGAVGFCRIGPALWDDLAEVAPTYLDGPPAILQPLVNPYLEALRPGAPVDELARHRLAVRRRLGGRVVAVGIGGAPVPADLRSALEACLRAPVREAYGATEAGTIAEGGKLRPEVRIRLVDRPDLGFSSTDQPYPRGELAVMLSSTSPGYLEDGPFPKATFSEDGFFLTGDLVELRPGGEIRVLGRTSQVLKLADGRFASAEELEGLALASGLCRHAALVPAPQGPTLVVVPESALSPQELRSRLAAELSRHLGGRALPSILVDPQLSRWTPENGLLSPSFKPRRQAIAQHYAPLLGTATTGQPAENNVADSGLWDTLAQILKRPPKLSTWQSPRQCKAWTPWPPRRFWPWRTLEGCLWCPKSFTAFPWASSLAS